MSRSQQQGSTKHVPESCDCGVEHGGDIRGRKPQQKSGSPSKTTQNDPDMSQDPPTEPLTAAGDFLPQPPPDEKVCDSYIGYKRAVLAALDTSFMYMYVVNRLKTLHDDDHEEAFKLLDRVPFIHNIIVWISTSTKSDRDSRRLRLDGDGYMRKRDYRTALVRYNGAVLTAPPDSQCLAEAYAGRARALFYICDYRGCMENVDAAFDAYAGTTIKSASNKPQNSLEINLKISFDTLQVWMNQTT
jgi:succinate dehydrogenase flavin-adding protein (antitoxin of CptAB toxin-antitoxin module)